MTATQRITNALGYAGLIPFVVPALLIAVDYKDSALLASLVNAYAFGIICFLTGSWWGMALLPGSRAALMLSNLYFLIAFFIFLFANQVWSLAAAVLLTGIFLAEQYSSMFSEFPRHYRSMRTYLTLVASASMLAVHFTG